MNLQPSQLGSDPTKGSDPNWLGGAGGKYACKSIPASLSEHDGLQASNDMAWRAVA
jgi:hypothetical protein